MVAFHHLTRNICNYISLLQQSKLHKYYYDRFLCSSSFVLATMPVAKTDTTSIFMLAIFDVHTYTRINPYYALHHPRYIIHNHVSIVYLTTALSLYAKRS